jgi:hypothetical protein
MPVDTSIWVRYLRHSLMWYAKLATGKVRSTRHLFLLVVFAFSTASLAQVIMQQHQHGSAGHVAQGPQLTFPFPDYTRIHGLKVYRVGHGVQPPVLLAKPNQLLAPNAEGRTLKSDPAGQIGTVIAWAIIDDSGAVRYPRIVRGLTDDENKRALQEVKLWRFAPATRDGSKVAAQVQSVVKFE